MLTFSPSTKWTLALGALIAASLSGCVDAGDADALEGPDGEDGITMSEVAAAVATSTTSVCVTKTDHRTVRVDGVPIAPDGRQIVGDYVLVSRGGGQSDQSFRKHLVFVESGGAFVHRGSENGVFVAAGGTVGVGLLSFRPKLWVKANGKVECGFLFPQNGVVIHHEPGAILSGCSGATLVPETVTDTFRRCPATTAVNELQPKLHIAAARKGQSLTVTNRSTGSYAAPRWTLTVVPAQGPAKTLFQTTGFTGFHFLLPANFDTLYTPTSWSRRVDLGAVDPFGIAIQAFALL